MNILEGLVLLQLQNGMRHSDRANARDWAEVLATFPLFAGVGKRRLRKLVLAATFAEVAAGHTVAAYRGSSDSVYIILGGSAKALRNGAVSELGVGDYFGELERIDGPTRSATVVSKQELHVMRLPAEPLLRLARQHPTMMLNMLAKLSTQLRLEAQVGREAMLGLRS